VEDAAGALFATALDAEWLRHRIWERVEVAPAIEDRMIAGVRLLVLYVAEAREPVRSLLEQLVGWRTGSTASTRLSPFAVAGPGRLSLAV
jgi:ATP-dependent DNA helicase RecG